LHSTPFVACHEAQAWGSPLLAVAWQSAATDVGLLQLAVQKFRKSSQLWSGGGPESSPGGAASAFGVGWEHAPR
jgi:hypothetical protein